MKKIIPIVFSLLLIVSACSENDSDFRPEWLSDKISEILTEKDSCELTSITVYSFNEELFYNIYCGYWSCMFCHLYDADGNKVELGEEKFENFHKVSKVVDEFSACE